MEFFRSASLKFFLPVLLVAIVLGLAPVAGAEDEDKPTASVSVDILNQYISRGVAYSEDSAVFQPSMTFGYKGFSLNMWGNFDTDDEVYADGDPNWNETDLTLTYTRELFANFNATFGAVYYAYENADDSVELIFGGAYAFPWLTVGLTAYWEVTHYPGWWIVLDLSRTWDVFCDAKLTTGMSFGYMILNDEDNTLNEQGAEGDYSELHSSQVYASLAIPFAKYFTISPKVALHFPLTDNAADRIEAVSVDEKEVHVVGGINIGMSF